MRQHVFLWSQGILEGLLAADCCPGQPSERARHTHPPGKQQAWLGGAVVPSCVLAGSALALACDERMQIGGEADGKVRSACSHELGYAVQVRVFGPRSDPVKALGHEIAFTSQHFGAYAHVR